MKSATRKSLIKLARTRYWSSYILEKKPPRPAKFIRDMAIEKDTIMQFIIPASATREILNEESGNVKDGNLKDLLPFGFAFTMQV